MKAIGHQGDRIKALQVRRPALAIGASTVWNCGGSGVQTVTSMSRALWILLLAAAVLFGCGRDEPGSHQGGTPMILSVNWQRLVNEEGATCARCGGTQAELSAAIEMLRTSLRPLGIEIAYVESELTPDEFAADMVQSNRILLGDRTLEEWLGAEVGQSDCESCCPAIEGSAECRTVSIDGNTYEVIPASLIVRAGLLAASQMLGAPSQGGCCPGDAAQGRTQAPCCPGSDPKKTAT